jgi:hypothetical protein
MSPWFEGNDGNKFTILNLGVKSIRMVVMGMSARVLT